MLLTGQLGMAIGLVASIAAIGAVLWSLAMKPKDRGGLSKFAFYSSYAGAIGFTVSIVILAIAFFTENYSIHYVLANRPNDATSLLWLYRFSGVWAGREGSLLFWTWVLSLFNTYVAYKGLKKPDPLHAPAIMVLNVVTALFTAVMVFSDANNPFIATSLEYFVNGKIAGAALGWGMSPILQHWAMIIHPPTLFIGYAGLTVPFAYAIAALIINDSSDNWVKQVDRITIFSWLFLGAGIGLGAVWAYVVLGWGGYWGWDPVENASILPWFVGVAMIHSFTMYRRRNSFKRWAVMSSAFTFSMVVLGTFITRTGIVQSVHTFGGDPLSLWIFLLIIIGAVLAAAIGLFLRWESFSGNDDEMESLTGKEAGYYFNNVLMTVASLIIAYMTISSALPSWMPFGQQSLGPVAYELIARPIGILYLFILAVCPLLSWAKTDAKVLWDRIKWPTVAALGLFVLLLIEWVVNLRPVYADMVAMGGDAANEFLAFGPEIIYDIIAVVGFFIASFVIANTGALFVRGVRARMKGKGENILKAFGSVLFKARTQSGGYISHIAMGIIVIGLIGSGMYVRDVSTNMPDVVGEKITVSDYTFVYTGKEEENRPNGDSQLFVTFDVIKNGKKLGSVHPSMTQFSAMGQNRLNAVVLAEPLRDIFMVFQGQSGDQLSVNVKINPLIWLVWGGFILLLVGTALASWPRKRAVA